MAWLYLPHLDRAACWNSKDRSLQAIDMSVAEEHRCHYRLAFVTGAEKTAAYLWLETGFGLDRLLVVLAVNTDAEMSTRRLMRSCQEPLVIVFVAKLLAS